MRYEHIEHGIPPVFNAESRVLILGTMPSPKSRENGFYYMHPQNRFWRVISTVLGEPLPTTNGERASLLLKNKIALWDTLAQCDIIGASDSSVKNAIPGVTVIIRTRQKCSIKAIFVAFTVALRQQGCHLKTPNLIFTPSIFDALQFIVCRFGLNQGTKHS